MPILCPYCRTVSADRTAHKLHLRSAHAEYHTKCIARSIVGNYTEGEQLDNEAGTRFVGFTVNGRDFEIPERVAEQVWLLLRTNNKRST